MADYVSSYTGAEIDSAIGNALNVDLAAVSRATEMLAGFDNYDKGTLGILQYCHEATSGEVHQIDKDSVYSKLTGQTVFADSTTALADRTIVQYHSATESQFSYWYKGTLVEVTGIKTLQLPDDNNANYIEYTSAGNLAVVTDSQEAIVDGTIVSLLVANSLSGNLVWFADERHGIVMDGQTHLNMHMTEGFKWVRPGCDIEGLSDNGTTFTKVTSGRCGDEDISMTFSDTTTTNTLYVDSAGNWDITGVVDNKLAHFVGAKVVYNPLTLGLGELLEIDSDYIVMTMLATNNKLYPFIKLMGQELYSNRTVARDHLYSALHEIEENGLPTHEALAIASFIIHNEGTGQIEKGNDDEVWIDHRRQYPVARF